MYADGFGKEYLSGPLSTSFMAHVEGMFCLGRRGGEIGDVGSDLGFLLIRVIRGVEIVGRCWTCEGMG